MAAKRTSVEQRKLNELLTRDHTPGGAILFGPDGYVIKMQAVGYTQCNADGSVAAASCGSARNRPLQ